jgi:hypothetical protein
MATKIILKKSATGGAVPLTSDIDQAELAINLADRKIYTKDNSGAITRLDGAYVDSVEPSNASEGDLWYDTVSNQLKAHNGSSFVSTGSSSLIELGVTATATELNYVSGVTSSIQDQIDGKAESNHTHSATDVTDFTEAAQDAVGSIISGTGIVSATYDDNANTIVISASESDTLDSVTGRGNTTTNDIQVANLTTTADVTVGGNLTVNGTTTTVNSNEVTIGDSIIVLNADEAGTPSQNAGFEVERGTSTNVQFVWNETDDAWDMGSYNLQNVTIDGGAY